MNLFVLVAVLCTGVDDSSQCDYYALDSNLSSYDCDYYFTDSGVDMVDGLITKAGYSVANLSSLECVEEETE